MKNENECSQENESPCGSKGKKCKKTDKKKKKEKKIKTRKTKTGMRNLKMMIGYAKIVGITGMMTAKIVGLSVKFHPQCSGIQYRTSQYWTLDLDNVYFECDKCK